MEKPKACRSPSRAVSTLHPSDMVMIDGLPADLLSAIPSVTSSSALYEMSKLPRAQSGLVKAAIMKQVKRLERRQRRKRDRTKWTRGERGEGESVSTVGSEDGGSKSFHAGQTRLPMGGNGTKHAKFNTDRKPQPHRVYTESWDFRDGNSSGEEDGGEGSDVRSLSTIESSAVGSVLGHAPPTTPRPSNAMTAYVRSHVDMTEGGLVIARKDSSMEEISQNLYALFINNAVLNPKGRRAINGRNRGVFSLLEHARVVKSTGQRRAELRAKQWNQRERRKLKGGRDMFRALRRSAQSWLAGRFLQLKMGADMVKAAEDLMEKQEMERREREKQWSKQSKDTAAMLLWNTCVKIGRRRLHKGWVAFVGNVESWQVVGRLLLRLAKIKVMSAMSLWKIKTKTAKADETLIEVQGNKKIAAAKMLFALAYKVHLKTLRQGMASFIFNAALLRSLSRALNICHRQMLLAGFKSLSSHVTTTALSDLDATTSHARELKSQLSDHLDNLKLHAAGEILMFANRQAFHKVRRAFYTMVAQCEGAGELKWVVGKVIGVKVRRTVGEFFRRWEREAKWRGAILARRKKGAAELNGIVRRIESGWVRRAFYTMLAQCDGAEMLKKAMVKIIRGGSRRIMRHAFGVWCGEMERIKAGGVLGGRAGRERKKSLLRHGVFVWRKFVDEERERKRIEGVKLVAGRGLARVWNRVGSRFVRGFWMRWIDEIDRMRAREESVSLVLGKAVKGAGRRENIEMLRRGWKKMRFWTQKCGEVERRLERLAVLGERNRMGIGIGCFREFARFERAREIREDCRERGARGLRRVMGRVEGRRREALIRGGFNLWNEGTAKAGKKEREKLEREEKKGRGAKGIGRAMRRLGGRRDLEKVRECFNKWFEVSARVGEVDRSLSRLYHVLLSRNLQQSWRLWIEHCFLARISAVHSTYTYGNVKSTLLLARKVVERVYEERMREGWVRWIKNARRRTPRMVMERILKNASHGMVLWGWRRWGEHVREEKRMENETRTLGKVLRAWDARTRKTEEIATRGAWGAWREAVRRGKEEEREREVMELKVARGTVIVRERLRNVVTREMKRAFVIWREWAWEIRDEERERSEVVGRREALVKGMVRRKCKAARRDAIGWGMGRWKVKVRDMKEEERERETMRLEREGRERRVRTVVRIRVRERYKNELGWGWGRWVDEVGSMAKEEVERARKLEVRIRFLRLRSIRVWMSNVRESWMRWSNYVDDSRREQAMEEEGERMRKEREERVGRILRRRIEGVRREALRDGIQKWHERVREMKKEEEGKKGADHHIRMVVRRRIRQYERDGMIRGWVKWVAHTAQSRAQSTGKDKIREAEDIIALVKGRLGEVEGEGERRVREGRERVVRMLFRNRIEKVRREWLGKGWGRWVRYTGWSRGREMEMIGKEVNVRRTVRRILEGKREGGLRWGWGAWRDWVGEDRRKEGEEKAEEERVGRRRKIVAGVVRRRLEAVRREGEGDERSKSRKESGEERNKLRKCISKR